MVQALTAHSYQFDYMTPLGRWRWTTVFNVSGPVPSVQVQDIISPFGRLRDSIPIPGEVVESMAVSIETVRQQFPPEILVGPPTNLVFIVDEGRGWSTPMAVTVANAGSFGSLLAPSLVSSAPYVGVTPTKMGSLGFNASGLFEASVDSTLLEFAHSPYSETVAIQDANAINNPVVLPVEIIVRPKAIISAGPQVVTFLVTKPLDGPFPPIPAQAFQVQNTGPSGSVLDWQVARLGSTSSWLAGIGPSSGTLESGQSATVQVQVLPDSRTMAGTTYTETLRVSGYSSNHYTDVVVNFQVL